MKEEKRAMVEVYSGINSPKREDPIIEQEVLFPPNGFEKGYSNMIADRLLYAAKYLTARTTLDEAYDMDENDVIVVKCQEPKLYFTFLFKELHLGSTEHDLYMAIRQAFDSEPPPEHDKKSIAILSNGRMIGEIEITTQPSPKITDHVIKTVLILAKEHNLSEDDMVRIDVDERIIIYRLPRMFRLSAEEDMGLHNRLDEAIREAQINLGIAKNDETHSETPYIEELTEQPKPTLLMSAMSEPTYKDWMLTLSWFCHNNDDRTYSVEIDHDCGDTLVRVWDTESGEVAGEAMVKNNDFQDAAQDIIHEFLQLGVMDLDILARTIASAAVAKTV